MEQSSAGNEESEKMRYKQGIEVHFRTNDNKVYDNRKNKIAGVSVNILFHFYKGNKEVYFEDECPCEKTIKLKKEEIYISQLIETSLSRTGTIIIPTKNFFKLEYEKNYSIDYEIINYYKQVYVNDLEQIKKIYPNATNEQMDIFRMIPMSIPEEVSKERFETFINKNWEHFFTNNNHLGQAIGWFYKT